jgi:putative ABC transport system permease protein
MKRNTISPRWIKVFRELRQNKSRSLLVVLSIAVGVFSIEMAVGARAILQRELSASFAASNPDCITLVTAPFDADLEKSIRRMPQVDDAEGRRMEMARIQTGPNQWSPVYFFMIKDFTRQHVNLIEPVSGSWPPAEGEILVEQAALELTHAAVGDQVTIKLPNGKEKRMRISGVVHDKSLQPASFEGTIYAYASPDTFERSGLRSDFDRLLVRLDPSIHDLEEVRQIARQVEEKVKDSGRSVYSTQMSEPGKPPLEDTIYGMMLLLGILSIFVVVLSAFLMFNTISALITQQTRQIGIMKSLGASRSDIAVLYLGMALLYGALAVLLALPLGIAGARQLALFIGGIVNSDITGLSVPFSAVLPAIVIGLLVPLLAAVYPVSVGVRISVLEALNTVKSTRLPGEGFFRTSHVLPATIAIPLRNLFRNRVRLVLSLVSLTLASAFFIAVVSTYTSTRLSFDQIFAYWSFDFMFTFDQPNSIHKAENVALNVPGVVDADPWTLAITNRVRADGSKSDQVLMYAIPADTFSVHPRILQGRWLEPEDENAVVITNKLTDKEPDIKVGDQITFKVQGKEKQWRVVGLAHLMMGDGPTVYVNLPYYSRTAGNKDRADGIYIQTSAHDPLSILQTMKTLEEDYRLSGINLSSAFSIPELRSSLEALFLAAVAILMIMAVLLSVVGGLGLMGIMSLNVLERSREIGIIRAVGATHITLMRLI